MTKPKHQRIRLKTLLRTLKKLGLSVDDIETKEAAVDQLSSYYQENGLVECECPRCEAKIPDVERCPLCSSVFEVDGHDPDKLQVRRGVRKHNAVTETGLSLLIAVVRRMKIPTENVALGGQNRLSLWSEYGVFATVRKGKHSLRFMLPYKSDRYGRHSKKITNLIKQVGKYKSRFSIGDKSEVGDAALILLETLKLVALERRAHG